MSGPVIASGTLYIRTNRGSGEQQYSTDNTNWNTFTSPLTIQNSNLATTLVVLFVGYQVQITQDYFICGSDNIQFGSLTLNPDGTKTTISVPGDLGGGVANYPGLIQNGTSGASGQNSITIVNLNLVVTNSGTCAVGGGWVAQEYFSKGASDNRILNCSSDGPIPQNGGGIVGTYAASGSSNALIIRGCSSSGLISSSAGGIAGANAGASSGSIEVYSSYSTGGILPNGGGILGQNAATLGGSALIDTCFSTGIMPTTNSNAGGIVGRGAGNGTVSLSGGTVTIQNCYSRGSASFSGTAGGITGADAGINNGAVIVINCYSAGTFNTGRGIFGPNSTNVTQTYTYVAGINWSDITANSSLNNIPGDPNAVWISTGIDYKWILRGIGYTAYSQTIVNSSTYELIQTQTENLQTGQTSDPAIETTGYTFEFLADGSGNPIDVDASTGAVIVPSDAPADTYTGAIIKYTGFIYDPTFYSITLLTVVVTEAPPAPTTTTQETFTLSLGQLDNPTYDTINELRTGETILVQRQENTNYRFNSYREYAYYKMAQASVRPS